MKQYILHINIFPVLNHCASHDGESCASRSTTSLYPLRRKENILAAAVTAFPLIPLSFMYTYVQSNTENRNCFLPMNMRCENEESQIMQWNYSLYLKPNNI